MTHTVYWFWQRKVFSSENAVISKILNEKFIWITLKYRKKFKKLIYSLVFYKKTRFFEQFFKIWPHLFMPVPCHNLSRENKLKYRYKNMRDLTKIVLKYWILDTHTHTFLGLWLSVSVHTRDSINAFNWNDIHGVPLFPSIVCICVYSCMCVCIRHT